MKLLQAIVAVLTVLLFFAKQKVFAGVCQVKKTLSQYSQSNYCDSTPRSPRVPLAACSLSARVTLPKHKTDPKIRVDNEDIDYYPVD